MEQELQRPQVLRVNKEDFIHGMLAGTFDRSKVSHYTHYVSHSDDYYSQTFMQLNHHKTDEPIYLEYQNPNGTLDLEISFELTTEFLLFFSHEAYVAIQKADGWFTIEKNCKFKENPCFRKK